MRKKIALIACTVGLTSALFAGCGNNDNNDDNVTTNNVDRMNRYNVNSLNDGDNYRYQGNRYNGYNGYGYTPGTMLYNAGQNIGDATRDLGRGAVNMTQDAGRAIGNAASELTDMNPSRNGYGHRYDKHANVRK